MSNNGSCINRNFRCQLDENIHREHHLSFPQKLKRVKVFPFAVEFIIDDKCAPKDERHRDYQAHKNILLSPFNCCSLMHTGLTSTSLHYTGLIYASAGHDLSTVIAGNLSLLEES